LPNVFPRSSLACFGFDDDGRFRLGTSSWSKSWSRLKRPTVERADHSAVRGLLHVDISAAGPRRGNGKIRCPAPSGPPKVAPTRSLTDVTRQLNSRDGGPSIGAADRRLLSSIRTMRDTWRETFGARPWMSRARPGEALYTRPSTSPPGRNVGGGTASDTGLLRTKPEYSSPRRSSATIAVYGYRGDSRLRWRSRELGLVGHDNQSLCRATREHGQVCGNAFGASVTCVTSRKSVTGSGPSAVCSDLYCRRLIQDCEAEISGSKVSSANRTCSSPRAAERPELITCRSSRTRLVDGLIVRNQS